MVLHAVGRGEQQRSLLDHFSMPARGTEVGWGVSRLGYLEKSEKKPAGEVWGLRSAV